MTIAFDNTYARLPERFFAKVRPEPVSQPVLLRLNDGLARQLGLDPDELRTPNAVALFAGNRLPEGAEPLAMAYAGHQFGSFVPQLGDGRAILLGELVTVDGARFDIQLKGSGRTPFSRSGDGRAWMGPVLREYLIGEAMHALGIPTTRALAAVTTGEPVFRERPLPGAILTRVARGHVRVGTFEYFRARQDHQALKTLADYVIARHYPEIADTDQPYGALLQAVAERQAELVAAWMSVGFIHGVMNTDNMSIAGETIDYGPCAFMDNYDPTTVFSSIDYCGRYAFGNQARIAHWNLASLGMSLTPLLEQESPRPAARTTAALDHFQQCFDRAWLRRFGRKLGLSAPEAEDRALVQEFLHLLERRRADFTNSFRALCTIPQGESPGSQAGRETSWDPSWGLGAATAPDSPPDQDADSWVARWRERLARDPLTDAERARMMRNANPAVIPRNHRVEQALDAATEGDLAPFEQLLGVLEQPWDDTETQRPYRAPPKPREVVQYTFCGT